MNYYNTLELLQERKLKKLLTRPTKKAKMTAYDIQCHNAIQKYINDRKVTF